MRVSFMSCMGLLALAAALSGGPAWSQIGAEIDVPKALTCQIAAPAYIGFAMNLGDKDVG
jgi:hypothetical protein